MSQENVELVQRCFRLFSRGDYDGVPECFDTIQGLAHCDRPHARP
jgi:hypothetical protein